MAVSAHSPGLLERRLSFPGTDALAAWARWNTNPSRLYTLGVEDEVMLLDPSDWSLAQESDRVLRAVSPDLARSMRPETHAGVVELVTGIHGDVSGVMSEVHSLRQRLASELRELGLTVAAAGTHPSANWEETEVSSTPRYSVLAETMRTLVRREPTMALHVHVGVPDPHEAVRLMNAVRSIVPLFIALSANSPYSRSRDSGFACGRRTLFQAFPRTGTPRAFPDYHSYVDAVEALVAPAAVPDPSFLWWDVRLQPRFGTVELRMMDAQSTVADVAPLIALIQSFARLVLEGDFRVAGAGPEVVEENGFLAARDGMDARLIDPEARQLVPARELVDALLERCRPHAAVLACSTELDGIVRLSDCNGAQWQRASLEQDDRFEGLVARLADQFAETGIARR
jgi:glutamate---cysteine ligase / carboxylate-amine ligase